MKKLQNSRAAAAALAVVFFIAGNAALSAQALNTAIKSMSEEIARSVPQDSAIAILGVDAPAQNLSNYIVNELTGALIRAGRGNNLSIVDRQETDQIRAELNFQESGEVSEESAQMMGQTLGASAILTGTMLHAGGDAWQLTFRVIAIDTRRLLSLSGRKMGVGRRRQHRIQQL